MTPAASRNGRGFTLVEMLIVLAIVAILTGIAYPSYLDFIRKAWRSEARSALMQQMQQQERYFTLEGQYRHYEGDSGDGGGKYTIVTGRCEGRSSIASCLRLSARLKPGLSDPHVGNLWLDSTGNRSCDGTRPDRCWQ